MLIYISRLHVCYDSLVAVSDASLDISEDDFIGVIGPNGGGKTSLIKAVLGLVPYSGKITYGEAIRGRPGSIGYLPQKNNFDLSFPITVQEIILSGFQEKGRIAGRFSKSQRAKMEELLELTGINNLRNRPVNCLSGGELQRALLCRALVSDPKLLILDEPANFVDNKFERELYEILRLLNDRMSIIMVSHDLGTITPYVKSVVCVNKTVHRHYTNELTSEMLRNYNCPIQLVSHGSVPHIVLDKH